MMDAASFRFVAVVTVTALLAACTGAAVWWHYRRRLAELQRHLQEVEQTRLELYEHANDLQERLDAADRVATRPPKVDAAGDVAARRQQLERLLQDSTPGPAVDWQDTQPISGYPEPATFAATEPAEFPNTR